MIIPFCFTAFLSKNKALKKHDMKPFFLQITVGMEKVGSWLLIANHYGEK